MKEREREREGGKKGERKLVIENVDARNVTINFIDSGLCQIERRSLEL